MRSICRSHRDNWLVSGGQDGAIAIHEMDSTSSPVHFVQESHTGQLDVVKGRLMFLVVVILYHLLESEQRKRDTIRARGNTIENWGYLFIYMFGCTYVIFVLRPWYFCVSLVVDPVPSFTKQNPLVYYRSYPYYPRN